MKSFKYFLQTVHAVVSPIHKQTCYWCNIRHGRYFDIYFLTSIIYIQSTSVWSVAHHVTHTHPLTSTRIIYLPQTSYKSTPAALHISLDSNRLPQPSKHLSHTHITCTYPILSLSLAHTHTHTHTHITHTYTHTQKCMLQKWTCMHTVYKSVPLCPEMYKVWMKMLLRGHREVTMMTCLRHSFQLENTKKGV